MSDIFDMERTMPSLTFQEKSLYGSLAAEVLVYGAYFVHNHHTTANHVAGLIFGIIVLQIIIQSIIAIVTRNRLTDERDRLIAFRGYRAGYFALVTGILSALTLLWAHAVAGLINPNHAAIHFINVLFAVLVLAELVKTITQLVSYRMDA